MLNTLLEKGDSTIPYTPKILILELSIQLIQIGRIVSPFMDTFARYCEENPQDKYVPRFKDNSV